MACPHNRAPWWTAPVAGAVSGAVSRFAVAPLDVVKIRLQLQQLSPMRAAPSRHGTPPPQLYNSLLGTFRSVFAEEGITSLWRGNVVGMGLWIAYGACQFSAFQLLSNSASSLGATQAVVSFAGGAAAGAVATTATYPLDLLRTRMAGQGIPKVHHTARAFAAHIIRSEGLRGLYAGLTPSLVQIMPLTGLQFAFFRSFSSIVASLRLSDHLGPTVVGGVAGCCAKTLVLPLETTKRRLQAESMSRASRYGTLPRYRGWIHCLSHMYHHEGVRALYQGLVPAVLKSGFATGITFGVYTHVSSWVHDHHGTA